VALALASGLERLVGARRYDWQAVTALAAAASAADAARRQLQGVVLLQASAGVMRAAQADLNAAEEELAQARAARAAAAHEVRQAAEAVGLARQDFERCFPGAAPKSAPKSAGEPTEPAPAVEPAPAPSRAEVSEPYLDVWQPAGAAATLALDSPWQTPRVVALSPRRPWGAIAIAVIVLLGVLVAVYITLSRSAVSPPAPRAAQAYVLPRAVALPLAPGHASAPNVAPPVPAGAADPHVALLTGRWAGNGAECSAPLQVAVVGKSRVVLTMLGATTQGTIDRIDAAGGVVSAWPDGRWVYKATPKTLTMTPPQGSSLTYRRCAGSP
jgi:hypothetical protein